jgi:AraC family transcriptional regulator, arabinose operon regulatory protein
MNYIKVYYVFFQLNLIGDVKNKMYNVKHMNPSINIYPEDESLKLPLRLISVGHGVAPPNCVLGRQNYEFLLIEYVLKGKGFVEVNSEYHICHADSLYILPPGMDHRYGSFADDPWEKIFFICEGELVGHLLAAYHLESLHVVHDCADLLHYFREFEVLKNGSAAHLEATLVVHRLFQDIFLKHFNLKDKRRISSQSVELKRELDRNLENKVSMDMLASKIGCSKVYLIRMFKKDFGVTPYDYLMNKRIESAKILLTHSLLFLKEIAERLCFSDQYYFSNYFKKKTGLSPLAFRGGNNR